MAQSLYILSGEPRSGKSLVMLGLMELLSGQARNIGFFRPVVRDSQGRDGAIHLVSSRYAIKFPYQSMFGCTYQTARDLLMADREDELLKRILDKYKALEIQCEAILCLGTDFTGVGSALEFDFNAEVANNLGCLVVPVAKGHGRSAPETVDAVGALLESLEERKCDILATVVNRVSPDLVSEVSQQLRRLMPDGPPIYVIPEHSLLGKPTVGEIAAALGASCISGDAEKLNREVGAYKVAAMELPHFLDHLEPGSLIITPGDRSDIILGSLLADVSENYPQIAGLLLTGGLHPAPQVQRLIEGLADPTVPVICVETDTYVTATRVSPLEGTLAPESSRKIAAALGVIENSMDIAELSERLSVRRSTRVTPLMFEYELVRRARERRQHVVLPEGTDERILRAAEILLLRGVVDVTLLGDPDQVRSRCTALGLALDQAAIIDPARSQRRELFAQTYYERRKHKGISLQMAYDAMIDVSYFGTMMVYHGDADAMVSGAAHTTQHTIRPAFEIIRTAPGRSLVSSVFFMCLEDRVLVFGDCAVNPNPNAAQLADIAIVSAQTASRFGIEPRIAMLSYSTGESGKGEDVDRVREATTIAKRLRPDLKIDGPLQYDAAVDAEVAASKPPGSEVAGHATVFIFPDLNTGNNTYKAVQRSANAVAIGPILQGLNKPVNDLSRGCTVTDVVNTVAITAIQAQAGDHTS